MDYRVRSSQSGILLHPVQEGDDASYAGCVAAAATLSLKYPNDQLCVVPQGASVLSARPPLTYQELQALPANARRQTVLLQA